MVTDGPFAETREQIGGYWLIDVKDLDAEIDIAARIPSGPTGVDRHRARLRQVNAVGGDAPYKREEIMSTTSKLAMNRKIVPMNTLGTVALAIVLCGVCQFQAQGPKTPYPSMAPIEQYLMDRNAEIALARSAPPESISRDAEVAVLGRHGYETAVKGKNGFVCVVERSWMSPFGDPQFWNPKLRGPICFNPPDARSILPLTCKRTVLVLAGLSKAQIIDSIKAFDKKELPPLELGGMCYMLSSKGYLNDSAGHWVRHLMFYVPQTDGLVWGADLPGSPVMLNPQSQGAPELASDCVHDSGAQVGGRNGRTQTKQISRARVIKSSAQAAPYLAGMEAGWTQSLERLAAYVAKHAKE